MVHVPRKAAAIHAGQARHRLRKGDVMDEVYLRLAYYSYEGESRGKRGEEEWPSMPGERLKRRPKRWKVFFPKQVGAKRKHVQGIDFAAIRRDGWRLHEEIEHLEGVEYPRSAPYPHPDKKRRAYLKDDEFMESMKITYRAEPAEGSDRSYLGYTTVYRLRRTEKVVRKLLSRFLDRPGLLPRMLSSDYYRDMVGKNGARWAHAVESARRAQQNIALLAVRGEMLKKPPGLRQRVMILCDILNAISVVEGALDDLLATCATDLGMESDDIKKDFRKALEKLGETEHATAKGSCTQPLKAPGGI